MDVYFASLETGKYKYIVYDEIQCVKFSCKIYNNVGLYTYCDVILQAFGEVINKV